MQNAKCKMNEAFRLGESHFYGIPLRIKTQRIPPSKEIFIAVASVSFSRSPILHFAFCILHLMGLILLPQKVSDPLDDLVAVQRNLPQHLA